MTRRSRYTKKDERGWYYLDNLHTYSQERLQQLIEENRIEYTSNGTPRIKNYLHEGKGTLVDNIWTDIDSLNSQAAERLGYPTQKPEALMQRIISASSNEGDWILDAYCGCGTTVAVAQRLNRRWIGIDITYQSISLILRRLEQQHGKAAVAGTILDGMPKDMAAAHALAHKKDDRVRKEFEKWAVLTYSDNRAVINEKKGGDQGIDGTGFFLTGENLTGKNENAKIVFQVKSGSVGRGDISKFNNDRVREGAELGIFITLEPPTQGMISEAKAAGDYDHTLMSRRYNRIQIVTIQEILEQHRRLDIPMSLEVLKISRAVDTAEQLDLFAGSASISGPAVSAQATQDEEEELEDELEEEA